MGTILCYNMRLGASPVHHQRLAEPQVDRLALQECHRASLLACPGHQVDMGCHQVCGSA